MKGITRALIAALAAAVAKLLFKFIFEYDSSPMEDLIVFYLILTNMELAEVREKL